MLNDGIIEQIRQYFNLLFVSHTGSVLGVDGRVCGGNRSADFDLCLSSSK